MSTYTNAPIGHVQVLCNEGQKVLVKEARLNYYSNYDAIFNKKSSPAGESNQQQCCVEQEVCQYKQ